MVKPGLVMIESVEVLEYDKMVKFLVQETGIPENGKYSFSHFWRYCDNQMVKYFLFSNKSAILSLPFDCIIMMSLPGWVCEIMGEIKKHFGQYIDKKDNTLKLYVAL